MKLNIDKFTGIAKQKKNVIILNGCDIEAFPRAEKKSNKEFILLFSGRLVKQKDPFTFLNALKILLDNNIPFKAKIIGDGIMRKDMEAFVADHKLGEHVLFSGWISKGVMADELRAAAIMVQTSLHEAMSISIMEAMACGTYVICTPVGMNKDLIFSGETGDIFAVGNARQLAEKIESFYYDKFLAGFSISSEMTSRFQQAYDWKKIVPQYEDYFISVLNLKQSP